MKEDSHYYPFLFLIAISLVLSGCGGGEDVSPPWENDARADTPAPRESGTQAPQSHTSSESSSNSGGGGDAAPRFPAPVPGSTQEVANSGRSAPVPSGSGSVASTSSLFPQGLTDLAGRSVPPSRLQGKYVGIYFAAHWCAPCASFTPQLVDFRNQHSDDFEVVWVSLDNSQGEKAHYARRYSMPWLTTSGARSSDSASLAARYGSHAMPQLVIISPDGRVIATQAEPTIRQSPSSALSKWRNM